MRRRVYGTVSDDKMSGTSAHVAVDPSFSEDVTTCTSQWCCVEVLGHLRVQVHREAVMLSKSSLVPSLSRTVTKFWRSRIVPSRNSNDDVQRHQKDTFQPVRLAVLNEVIDK